MAKDVISMTIEELEFSPSLGDMIKVDERFYVCTARLKGGLAYIFRRVLSASLEVLN